MRKLLQRFSGELVLVLALLLAVNGSLVGLVYGNHEPGHDGGNPNASPSPSASVDPSASPEASPSASPSDNPGQGGGQDERVPVNICHATHSEENPFTTQTVDDDSVDGIGEGNGQSADHNRDDHQDGEDIIPPGPWDPDGRNWTEDNQAIWNNNCNGVEVIPSPSASASADPTSAPSSELSSGTGGSTSESTPAPTSQGQVLGASTLADTGSFEQTATSLIFTVAAGLVWLGTRKIGQE